MRTTVTKLACVLLLIVATLFWREANSLRVLMNSAICAGAIVVLMEASAAKKKYWVAAFAIIAIVFNPMAPVSAGNASLFVALAILAIVAFAASIFILKPQLMPSVPSITDRTPGSESL